MNTAYVRGVWGERVGGYYTHTNMKEKEVQRSGRGVQYSSWPSLPMVTVCARVAERCVVDCRLVCWLADDLEAVRTSGTLLLLWRVMRLWMTFHAASLMTPRPAAVEMAPRKFLNATFLESRSREVVC